MAPNQMFRDLVAYLSAPTLKIEYATEALKEWILHRRSKGDTLFEVSIGLVELEQQTPPHTSIAFEWAKQATHIPDTSNLTPPTGVFPLHRSQSPMTILNHLFSQPTPEFSHSLEVMYEYLSIRENKLKEKKAGKGGKGTLSREALEDMSARLTEIENGLVYVDGRRLEPEELDEPRATGMTLILSTRMSFSYFTLNELVAQLLILAVPTCESLLVAHIKRRVEGEGRWAVGNELEHLERVTLPQRPALVVAFRSAKARTLLPEKPISQIPLPAPNKSTCIKLIQNFSGEGMSSSSSGYFSRKGFAGTNHESTSPKSPTSPLPPLGGPSHGPSRVAEYAHEVLNEYATRERREYMLKCKWAKSGREQLGKDIGEMEQALCLLSRQQPSPMAPTLLPVFLTLRRTFLLPPSTLPPKLVDAFIEELPPSAQEEPFREPTLQSATSSLYVNPRLDDATAFKVIEELLVYETDMLKNSHRANEVPSALHSLIDNIQMRFPDGSYDRVFDQARRLALTGNANTGIAKQPSTHRRAISSFVKAPEEDETLPRPPHLQHSRSTSLPHRRNTIDSITDTDSDESIGIELTATRSATDRASIVSVAVPERPPILPPLSFASPAQPEREEEETPEPTPSSAGGWWDVVSAVQTHPPSAPWSDNYRSTNRTRTTSGGFSSLPLPPGAEPATISQLQEPQLDLLKLIERSTPTSSDPATPANRVVSLEVSPIPSPCMDFTKRQSVTTPTLNEELGNLMISTDPQMSNTPNFAPTRTELTPLNTRLTTPYGPARHKSDLGQSGGSSSRASPPIPGYHRSQTDSSVAQSQTVATRDGSDSDSDSEISPSQPTIRHVGPASQHPMLQTMARAPIATPPSNRASASPMSSATKPKSRGWKSVSAAMGISKDKDKHKDKDKDKENEKIMKNGNKAWPENDPGRWNKNMVANIMGPPADRR